MRREAVLPAGFEGLRGKVQFVQRATASEYSSSCPRCGGGVHQGGEWPDRFRMFTRGKIRGWCRKCEFVWFPDMENGEDWRPTAEEILERAKAAEKALEDEIKRAESVLEDLRASRVWVKYHEQMKPNHYAHWCLRGLDSFWVDWWKLGFCFEKKLWKKEGGEWVSWWSSESLTIPVWWNGWEVMNIKHRLLKSPPGLDFRYIQEKGGVSAFPFLCDPDRRDGPLLLVEGEIKAMVSFATLDTGKVQVSGLPTSTPNDEMMGLFSDYEPIYICMDPDTFDRIRDGQESKVEKVGRLIGERARIVELPEKVDDLIIAGSLNREGLRRAIRRARKL